MSSSDQQEDEQPQELEILRTVHLRKFYPVRGQTFDPFSRKKKKFVSAVDDVSITIPKGKTVAIVGESGCGKTSLAQTIMGLTPITSGEIYLDGLCITDRKIKPRQLYRNIQMVFQDPDSSLDPRMTVGDSIAEPLQELTSVNKQEIKELVFKSLEAVGLSKEFAFRVPRELSGGQKQRVAIARAIAPSPKIILLDEPTSALDVSVQAQILSLLLELQRNYKLTYVLITHNIAVAQYLSDTVAVMYAGNLVEYGPTETILGKPRHPYTIALIASAPVPDPWKRNLLKADIRGEVPSAVDPPTGCRFNPRCPFAELKCTKEKPQLALIGQEHLVACHFVEKTA